MDYTYKKMISDIRQDLARYVAYYSTESNRSRGLLATLLHSPGYYVIASYRILYWLNKKQKKSGNILIKLLLGILSVIAHRYWAIAMKSSISGWPTIGPGMYFSNKGGIILGARTIGAGCIIHQNVTIGKYQAFDNAADNAASSKIKHPSIGNNVCIGANSLLYGEITIRDGVIILPHTIIGKSLPASVVIKGNPGRIIHRNIEGNSELSDFCNDSKVENNKNYV